jgi:hypothetical protein
MSLSEVKASLSPKDAGVERELVNEDRSSNATTAAAKPFIPPELLRFRIVGHRTQERLRGFGSDRLLVILPEDEEKYEFGESVFWTLKEGSGNHKGRYLIQNVATKASIASDKTGRVSLVPNPYWDFW